MKTGFIFVIAVLMLVLMLPAYGGAGTSNTSVIQGVVIDKNANPIQRAQVLILGTSKWTRADINGVYRFDSLAKGYTCKLEIKANHFQTQTNISAAAKEMNDPSGFPTTTLADCPTCALIDPFMVAGTEPANGVFNADKSTKNIKITYEMEVNPSTINASTIIVKDMTTNSTVSGSFAVNGKVVTFTPTSAFTPGTTYRVDTTTGVKAKDNKAQSEAYASVFSIRKYDVFFGDIHSHSNYSNDAYNLQAIKTNNKEVMAGAPTATVAASVASAKKRGLDFIATTDHAEMITTPDMKKSLDMDYETCMTPAHADDLSTRKYIEGCNEWKNILADVNTANADSSNPIVFPGWEYTRPTIGLAADGKTEIPYKGGGHKCVIFKDASWTLPPFTKDQGDPHDLWNYLGATPCITIPHHPARTKAPDGGTIYLGEKDMSTDWSCVPDTNKGNNIPNIMPLVEIYSVHGSSEDLINGDDKDERNLQVPGFEPTKSVDAALKMWFNNYDQAYQLGIIASTDDHTSRPGNCLDESWDAVVTKEGDFTGGLIATLAPARNRVDIFNALKAKRTYGTSGPRINVDFAATTPQDSYTQYHMGNQLVVTVNHRVNLRVEANPGKDNIKLGNITLLEVLKYTKSSSSPVVTTINGNKANLTFIMTEPTIFRVIAYHNNSDRYVSENRTVKTRERAWSSPIWVKLKPAQ